MSGVFSAFSRIFGGGSSRRLRSLRRRAEAIGELESSARSLSDEGLRERFGSLRSGVSSGSSSLDDVLSEVFSLVRESARRSLGQRHFDVQLMGGIALHEGSVAEMRTGEGKTLAATLAATLNAMTGRGVHVVTVNDYLARRDAEWMGKVYGFLGLTSGCVASGMEDDVRRRAYGCDVTYATNNELGFDYLRDNMKLRVSDRVQRGCSFAIVDEVDSILIDEARTPLVISGPAESGDDPYRLARDVISELSESHYEVDEKDRSATFTEEGNARLEAILRDRGILEGDSLYEPRNAPLVHSASQALRARLLFERDRDYIVREGEVVLIDEFTGRMTPGRRYSDGLHQALEAKEGVEIQPENRTLASITYQNYFRLYEKLSGMTGTAATESEELGSIYGLETIVIPTNVPMARLDEDDEIYRAGSARDRAVIELIRECRRRGQPTLVGTTSIAKSDALAASLRSEGIGDFRVLNARYHEEEAQIIAQAGIPGAITIATNMAGRGTDIQLGGNAEMRVAEELSGMPSGSERDSAESAIRFEVESRRVEAVEAGGLFVIGTERHESRRIDNQLRGRSGRQGDPGRSRFLLSLEDDLMRIFAPERMDAMLAKLGLGEDEALIHPWINRAVERSQRKVEARNFDMRKNLLKFDDVMNDQRKAIFENRLEIMESDDVSDVLKDMRARTIEEFVSRFVPSDSYPEQWRLDELAEATERVLGLTPPFEEWRGEDGIADDEIRERLVRLADDSAARRAADAGPSTMRAIEKTVLLQVLDGLWRDHLSTLERLRQVIGLRGYGQRDPLNEYRTEAFQLFQSMLSRLNEETSRVMSRVGVDLRASESETGTSSSSLSSAGEWGDVPRNAPCPCGSGRKYKRCHGRLDGSSSGASARAEGERI